MSDKIGWNICWNGEGRLLDVERSKFLTRISRMKADLKEAVSKFGGSLWHFSAPGAA
jgi:hypothetical protein